jgi:hypothetical protein
LARIDGVFAHVATEIEDVVEFWRGGGRHRVILANVCQKGREEIECFGYYIVIL